MSVWDHYFTQAALGAGAGWWKSQVDQSAGCMQLYCSAVLQYSAAVQCCIAAVQVTVYSATMGHLTSIPVSYWLLFIYCYQTHWELAALIVVLMYRYKAEKDLEPSFSLDAGNWSCQLWWRSSDKEGCCWEEGSWMMECEGISKHIQNI